MRDVQIYLTRVHAEIPADADRGTFPLTLPFVEGLDIQFKTPVTFIVGENGAGKSTLLEALADLADLPVRGGRIHEVTLEETSHYQVTRGILEAPERYWKHLRGGYEDMQWE